MKGINTFHYYCSYYLSQYLFLLLIPFYMCHSSISVHLISPQSELLEKKGHILCTSVSPRALSMEFCKFCELVFKVYSQNQASFVFRKVPTLSSTMQWKDHGL